MIEKNFNALEAIMLSLIIYGALSFQFFLGEEPCALCLIQRLGMIGIAISVLLNVRFYPRKTHYGLALLCATFGAFVALRQISLHACPGTPKFGVPFWGLSLYTWSFLIFGSTIIYNGLLLIFFDRKERKTSCNWFGHLAFWLVIVVCFINVIGSIKACGFGPCG